MGVTRTFASGMILSGAMIGLLVSAPLAASGGGGGGGDSVPSASSPRYDAAEEYRKGIEALKVNKFADAKRAFDHVLSAAPKADANTNYLAGLARGGLDDNKGAAKYFEKAVKFDPAMIGAYQQLGIAYAKLGDKAKAQAQVDALTTRATACAKTCPQAADLAAAIAAINGALGAAPQARIDTAPGPLFAAAAGDAAYLQAVALINEHRYEDAIVSLDQSRRAFGPHPDILTYLGFANRKLKRYDVAEAYYRQALAIAPNHRGATEYFGELMVERGDLAGARKMLAALDSRCTFGCAEAEELRGWIADGHARTS